MSVRATVVIAEDDDAVRRMMCALLVYFGHRALPAADGKEALLLCEAEIVIDLVITDLAMPGLDDHGLLRRLAAKEVPPRVLVCCGSEGVPGLPHLPKPFTPQQLRAAVEQALAGPRLSPEMLA